MYAVHTADHGTIDQAGNVVPFALVLFSLLCLLAFKWLTCSSWTYKACQHCIGTLLAGIIDGVKSKLQPLADKSIDPANFTESDWIAFFKRTGVLRARRVDGHWAPASAFEVLVEHHQLVYQMEQWVAEGDLARTKSHSGTSNQSGAVDKGGHIGGGGGIPGAQANVNAGFAKQHGTSNAAAQAGRCEDESHKVQYKAMTLLLHEERLTLSKDCKEFFKRTTSASLDTALKKFEDFFGTVFYQSVDVGASRERISASRREETSESADEDKARQLEANIHGDGPNANVNVGGHRNSGTHSADSTSASIGNKGSSYYSRGGNAVLAHIDDPVWRTSLSEPTSWVLLEDGLRDPIRVLTLVNEVAKYMSQANNVEGKTIYQRSSGLLQHLKQREIESQGAHYRQGLDASQHTFSVQLSTQDRNIIMTAPLDESIESIEAIISTANGTQNLLKISASDARLLGRFEIRGKVALGEREVGVQIICYLTTAWRPQQVNFGGGTQTLDIARSSEIKIGMGIFGSPLLSLGQAPVLKAIRSQSFKAQLERSVQLFDSPPSCRMHIPLQRGLPATDCQIKVFNYSLRKALVGPSE